MIVYNAGEFDSGERVYVGKTSGGASVGEHLARYEFALGLIGRGEFVLDAACGSGYGSQMLAGRARHVVGLDLSESALSYAAKEHQALRLSYVRADLARGLPLLSETVDVVVSFETIEHLGRPERLVAECERVLRHGGYLILSTPDRRVFTELSGFANAFHYAELSRSELLDLVSSHLEIEAIYGQRPWTDSPWLGYMKRTIRRGLPRRVLAAVTAANASMGRLLPSVARVKSDVSVHLIDDLNPELYFYLLVVARKV
jgi:SAM-dependent methyltransferase